MELGDDPYVPLGFSSLTTPTTGTPPPNAKSITTTPSSPVSTSPSDQEADELAKRLVTTGGGIPKKYKKTVLISGLVALGIIIIVIVVVVVVLMNNAAVPKVTPTPIVTVPTDPNHPSSIVPIKTFISVLKVPVEFHGVSVSQLLVYPQHQQNDNIGIVLSADNIQAVFVSVDVNTSTVEKTTNVISETATTGKVSSFVSVDKKPSFGVFELDARFNLFEVDVTTGNLNNRQTLAGDVTDPSVFNSTKYWSTTAVLPPPALPPSTTTIIASLVIPTQGGQVYTLHTQNQDGVSIPTITTGDSLVASGDYSNAVYSSNQQYLSIAFLNTNSGTIKELFYNGTTSDVKTIGLPGGNFGSLTCGSMTSVGDVLLTMFSSSLFVYKRSMTESRPTFAQTPTDYVQIPFVTETRYCALDDTGTWFVLSTTSNTIVFGELNADKTINFAKLRQIVLADIDPEPGLFNTSGPCGITLQKDTNNIIIVQADTLHNTAVMVVTAF